MKTGFWKTSGLAVVAAAALAACSGEAEDSAGDTPMAVEDAAREFSKLETPQPGQYDLDVEIVSFDLPGAPEGMLEQMRSAMEGAYADSFCLTPEEAEKGFEEQLGQVAQDSQCNFNEMSVADGKVAARAVCDLEGGTMDLAMNGTVTSTSSDITADTKMPAQGQTVSMTMRMKQTRTGDCAA